MRFQRELIFKSYFSQALRSIPELQPALNSFTSAPGPAGGLTAEMRKLYEGMNKTTEKFMPAIFLERLRQFAPQFAEFRPGQGYAQQGRKTHNHLQLNGFIRSDVFFRCRGVSWCDIPKSKGFPCHRPSDWWEHTF